MQNKVLESKKSYRGPQKIRKTVFLKNGTSHNLTKIKYVISEPQEDVLQWNLSWAFTFDFLVYQEGCEGMVGDGWEWLEMLEMAKKSKG